MKYSAKNTKQLLAILGSLFILFFIYVIYAANTGSIPSFIRQLYMFPGGDKLGHIVLLGLLSYFVNYLLYPRSLQVFGRSIFVGSLIVLILITVEEFSQIFVSSRSFDLLDLACSYIGVIVGDIGVKYYNHKARL